LGSWVLRSLQTGADRKEEAGSVTDGTDETSRDFKRRRLSHFECFFKIGSWGFYALSKTKISFEERGRTVPERKPGTCPSDFFFGVFFGCGWGKVRKNHARGGVGTDGDGVDRLKLSKEKRKHFFKKIFGGVPFLHFQFLKILSFRFLFFV
jgi:hypothetical protein